MAFLTLEKLKEMMPHTIIMKGSVWLTPTQNRRFVAKRGTMHDWAIYVGDMVMSYDDVMRYGDKLHEESQIRELVSCDDEAFAMYRQ